MYKRSKFEVASHPMFITSQALQAYLLSLFVKDDLIYRLPEAVNTAVEKECSFTSLVARPLAEKLAEQSGISLTTDYSVNQDSAIAYYYAYGPLMFDDYWWYFNTKEFLQDFKAAEANPSITAHLLHINSGGGMAYYLDEVHKVLSARTKPLIVQCEMYMCSAALYIGIPADKIFATTPFDTVGSIGTMVSFWDLKPYFEKEGFKWHEYYAHQSTRKNKTFNDMLDGKPEAYIKSELDPLAAKFIADVQTSRPAASGDGLFEGETYYAEQAIDIKLIDGIQPIEESINMAFQLGKATAERLDIQQNVNKFLT